MEERVEVSLTLGQRIREAMAFRTIFTVHIGNISVPVTETVVTTWIVMAVLIAFALVFTRRLREVPVGSQVFLEALVGFLNDFSEKQLGHHWRAFAPYLGTVALFLGFANLVGFFSPLPGFGFEPPFSIKPPTRDINVTAALALMTILIVVISTFRYKGIIGWLKSFIKPLPFMLPFNIIEYGIKPLSLCLRLFGNVLGAFIIMELIAMVVPLFVPPVASLYFDFFDGLVQAVVFVFLSTLYIAEAIE